MRRGTGNLKDYAVYSWLDNLFLSKQADGICNWFHNLKCFVEAWPTKTAMSDWTANVDAPEVFLEMLYCLNLAFFVAISQIFLHHGSPPLLRSGLLCYVAVK